MKKFLPIVPLVALLSWGIFVSQKEESRAIQNQHAEHAMTAATHFDYLSSNMNSSCSLATEAVASMEDTESMRGSCCGPMVPHRYEEQIEAMKQFSYIPEVPANPYDIPIPLTRKLLQHQKEITLSPDEQKTYNEAMKMAEEGGPCCCRCWRWFVYEGLAEFLIREHNFSSEKIAQVWDLSDGCGGEGHEHGHG